MSRQIHISFDVVEDVCPYLVLERLCAAGWQANCGGSMSFLPVGDVNDYDWQIEPYDAAEFRAVIDQKTTQSEQVGVSLCYGSEGTGCDFLFSSGKIICSLLADAHFLDTERTIVDFSWYLRRLVPPLRRAGVRIVAYQCDVCGI